jgi:hypothetical protein
MKKYLFTLILFYIAFASFVYAEVPINTGFIPGQIWYSKEPLIEGDTVKVYTAIWNGDDNSLSAKVTFYDKNVVLGTRDIIIPSGEMKDVSVSWQVTAGDHSISAKIVSSNISSLGKSEQVSLSRSSTKEDSQFVKVLLKTGDGTIASTSDIVKSQVGDVSSTISSVLPDSISTPISETLNNIDDFRDTTSNKIDVVKKETQKVIDSYNLKGDVTKTDKAKTLSASELKEQSKINTIDKPLSYIKLFFLSIISFIFSNKIVFYGLIILISFFIIRFIYRKIRNR